MMGKVVLDQNEALFFRGQCLLLHKLKLENQFICIKKQVTSATNVLFGIKCVFLYWPTWQIS